MSRTAEAIRRHTRGCNAVVLLGALMLLLVPHCADRRAERETPAAPAAMPATAEKTVKVVH